MRDVGGAAMLPGMRRIAGMGVHRVTLGSGGVVQGICLNGGSGGGGGGDQKGESREPNREFHSKNGVGSKGEKECGWSSSTFNL